MTFRDFLAVMALGSVAAWAAWIVVLVSIDPSHAGPSAIVFFHLTLSVALFGSIACIGSAFRAWRSPQELALRHVGRSCRQAVLVTVLVTATLTLANHGLMRWWAEGLAVLSVATIELAFISADHTHRTEP